MGPGPILCLATQQSRADSALAASGRVIALIPIAASCGAIGSVAAARFGPPATVFRFFFVCFLVGLASPPSRMQDSGAVMSTAPAVAGVALDRRGAWDSGRALEAAPQAADDTGGLVACRMGAASGGGVPATTTVCAVPLLSAGDGDGLCELIWPGLFFCRCAGLLRPSARPPSTAT